MAKAKKGVKSSPKKTTTKRSTVKKEISVKVVARNVILIINGQKYTKAFPDKVKKAEVIAEVEAYNKRNSIKREQNIINLMLKSSKTQGDKPKKVSKITETKSKKATKMSIEEAKKLLEQDGYTVSKQIKAAPTPSRRRGEY